MYMKVFNTNAPAHSVTKERAKILRICDVVKQAERKYDKEMREQLNKLYSSVIGQWLSAHINSSVVYWLVIVMCILTHAQTDITSM